MIPLNTTTIAVYRRPTPSESDVYDPADEPEPREQVESGVRAHISSPAGGEQLTAGAEREVVEFRLSCDPVVIEHDDVIVDEGTGEQFDVTWAHLRRGLGLDHVEAGLRMVSGAVEEGS